MWVRAIAVCLLAALAGCQTGAPAPIVANPAPSSGVLNLYPARLRLAIAQPRQVQALPDFWDQVDLTVYSPRLKAPAPWGQATASATLTPPLVLPLGPATVSVELRAQGILMATGSATASFAPGLNPVVVTMLPLINQVATLAGNGSAGAADGPGAVARFNGPRGLALDAAGNLFVADTSNHKIRKVTPQGLVTTLAGNGTPGWADGTGGAVMFNSPSGVAVDGGGNVFVADTQNHRVRKIDPGGNVTTLAGNGTPGSLNHTLGTNATFNQPWGIALDTGGNAYVSDFGNSLIRKVVIGSTSVTTFASTSLLGPSGLAIDAASNLYVANRNDSRVMKVTSGGTVIPFGGTGTAGFSGDGGPATSATFNQPQAVAVDAADNVYVADTLNYRIRRIQAGTGTVTTVAGSGSTPVMTDGPVGSARFGELHGIATRTTASRVYVGDWSHQRLRVLVGP